MLELKSKIAVLRKLVASHSVLMLGPEESVTAATQAMQKAKKGALLIVDGKKLCPCAHSSTRHCSVLTLVKDRAKCFIDRRKCSGARSAAKQS